ncbi:ATP-dependent Clp protease adaptor [compost metagenome]
MSDTLLAPVRTPSPSGTARSHREDRPIKVVLWNDDVNDVMHVIVTLVRTIAGMSLPQAQAVTMTAHVKGSAIAAETYRERAEFYREQLEANGLTASLE